jgi:hypothetical protein
MKTAVEQLFFDLEFLKMKLNFNQIKPQEYYKGLKESYHKCLGLEKQQLSNAFYAPTDIQTSKNFDDYYNETFKTE